MDCRPSNGAFKTADLPAKRFCRAEPATLAPRELRFHVLCVGLQKGALSPEP